MNKRARLARRILRDHRPGGVARMNAAQHMSKRPDGAWILWTCPHCPGGRFGVMEAPRAYR